MKRVNQCQIRSSQTLEITTQENPTILNSHIIRTIIYSTVDYIQCRFYSKSKTHYERLPPLECGLSCWVVFGDRFVHINARHVWPFKQVVSRGTWFFRL